MFPNPVFIFLFSVLKFTSATYPTTGTSSLIPWSETTDSDGVSIHIPFTFSNTPHARIRFSHTDDALGDDWEGSQLSFQVDTGTCGIIAHHERINLHPIEKKDPTELDPVTNRGQEWLSSSKILYTGYWVPRYVTFVHSNPVIKTYQPVLAVTKKFINCDWWEPSYGSACPGASEEDDSSWRTITNIGIGYGRSYDGQPQGTPDKNPLLNIDTIGGTALDSLTTFHPGWRINENGIQVGLKDDIWNDPSRPTRAEIPLPTPIPPPPPETLGRNPHFDWQEVRGCVKFPPISGSTTPPPCHDVAMLLDTGIGWSSIRVDNETAWAVRKDNDTQILKDNQIVDVFAVFPNALSPTASRRVQLYKFLSSGGSQPPACYWTPESTKVHYDNEHHRRKFVNTGRRVFRVLAFLLDPLNGRVGFHLRTDSCAVSTFPSYFGMTPAPP